MAKFFLSSHGHFASGIKSSVGILLGEVSSGNLTVFDAYVDERSLEAELDAFFDQIGEGEQAILLSDLYGGSVNNTMYTYLTRPNTTLIAGVNLALVIELLVLNKEFSPDELEEIVGQSREAMRVVTLEQDAVNGSNDEENDLF